MAEHYARQQQQQQQQRKSAHLIDVILLHLPSVGVHSALLLLTTVATDCSFCSPSPSLFPLNSLLERYIYIYRVAHLVAD